MLLVLSLCFHTFACLVLLRRLCTRPVLPVMLSRCLYLAQRLLLIAVQLPICSVPEVVLMQVMSPFLVSCPWASCRGVL